MNMENRHGAVHNRLLSNGLSQESFKKKKSETPVQRIDSTENVNRKYLLSFKV